MKATTIKIMIFSLMLVGVSCADYCSNLQTFVIHVLSQDVKNDKEMYDEILAFANEHSDKFERCAGDLFEDDVLSEQKLFVYINDIAKRKGLSPLAFNAKDGSQNRDPIRFKFYLESSASVWPYDKPGTDGEFKSAIVGLLNRINRVTKDDSLMFVVNTDVFPYPKSFQQFIERNDVYRDVQGIGNPTKTDFRLIFEKIMDDIEDNEVAVMVSDMIYSVPQITVNTPQHAANSIEGLMQEVFNRRADNVAALVVKCNGTYNGRYFYHDFASKSERWFNYQGNRPFYFMFFAKNDVMEHFLKLDQYTNVRDFTLMQGYENYYLFTSGSLSTPYYSILLNHPAEKARYKLEKTRFTQIKNLNKLRVSPYNNELQLVIGVDLSSYQVSEKFKRNPINYSSSTEGVSVIEVKPIEGFVSPQVGRSTHILLIGIQDLSKLQGEVKVSFLNSFAPWISASSTLENHSPTIPNFEKTTFVFEPMMRGIYKAYHGRLTGNTFFTLQFNLNR